MSHNSLQPGDPSYFRFLKLAQSVNSIRAVAMLTPNENQLLQEVALRHFEGQAFTIKQALALEDLGSPTTLHKRVQRLRKAGFLSIEQKETDHRTKYLTATALAIQHFECLGVAMHKALSLETHKAEDFKN
jgi:DNA-binding MarR family transcriptional regulator